MSFNDLLRKNASIMEAYTKMKESSCDTNTKDEIEESDDSGGDASAYNKYLLATTGDLPRTKEEYMKTEEILPNKFRADHEHEIKKVSGHKSEFKQQTHEPTETIDDKKKMSDVIHLKKIDEAATGEAEMRYHKWMNDVRAAHPDKKLIFRGKMEGGIIPTHTVTAEVHGDPEERAYGIWDHDKDEGHVFALHEEKMSDAQINKREKIIMAMKEKMPEFKKRYGSRTKDVIYAIATKKALEECALEESIGELLSPAVFKHGSRSFNTYAFKTGSAANSFMKTPQGQSYGYIGMDDQGQFHVANMDDQGVLDK
jgi:hypothetical protein